MKYSLSTLIAEAKENNQQATFNLIKTFEPALKKFSHKVSQEDTYQDLVYFLLQLIPKIPSSIKSEKALFMYVYKALKHEYIRLQEKEYRKNIEYVTENINETLINQSILTEKPDSNLYFYSIIDGLTQKEKDLIIALFLNNETIKSISQKEKVSVQAIYKRYYKILKKLKDIY